MSLRTLRDTPWWILLFFLVGLIATITVTVELFFSVGERSVQFSAPGVPPVSSEDFLRALGGAVSAPVTAGGTVDLLNNGEAFYPPMLEAIRSARQSVTFLVYIWEDGRISSGLLDALTDRARRGVAVRLLLDGFGGVKAPAHRLAELEAAGGRVARFRPPHFGMLTRFHRRNHRRAIVVDGTVGFTGGGAVADKWDGQARNPEEWRDSMVRVTGPLARGLQTTFAQSWASTTGEVLIGPAYFPPDAALDLGRGAALRHISLASSPAPDAHPLGTFFWLSCRAARRTLFLSSSYFVPDERVRQVVMERARAGVDVRLLLPGEHTDAKPIRWASHRYYDQLLAAGVRIYEYQPTFMHAKLLVVDGQWAVVGSANTDLRSEELNEENVLGILDARFAGEVEQTFRADLERAREIRLEEWRQRGVGTRVLERVAAVLSEQF